MIYTKGSFYVSSTASWTTSLYNYLRLYSDRFTLEDGYIIFDGKIKFKFTDNTRPAPQVVCNDENNTVVTLPQMGYWASGGTVYTTLIITDKVFYLGFDRRIDNVYYVLSIVIDDNDKYYTGGVLQNWSVNSVTFYDTDTAISGYSIGKLFNFAIAPYNILYNNLCPIFYSNSYNSDIHDLISCSTVTQGQVITFQGQNYYALGTNVLVPIDL